MVKVDLPDLTDLSISIESSKVNYALEKIIKSIELLAEQNAGLEHNVTVLTQTVNNQQIEINSLRDLLNAKTDTKGLHDRVRALEDLNIPSKLDTVARLEDKIPELTRKVDQCVTTVAENQPVIIKAEQTARDAADKVASMGEKFSDLVAQWNDRIKDIDALRGEFAELEAHVKDLSTAHSRLLRDVDAKYDKLWQDVLDALERMNFSGLKALEKELKERCEDAERKVKNLVAIASGQMADALARGKALSLKQRVVQAWREETWESRRRQNAVRKLVGIFLRREKGAFEHWNRDSAFQGLVGEVEKRMETQVTGAAEVAKESLAPRVQVLEEKVEALENTKTEMEGVVQQGNDGQEKLTAFEEKIMHMQELLDGMQNKVQANEEETSAAQEQSSSVQATLDALHERMDALMASHSSLAKDEDLKAMMKDVLLLWNGLKQLDAQKADRKELEAFAQVASDATKMLRKDLDEVGNKLLDFEEPLTVVLDSLPPRVAALENSDKASNKKLRLLNHMLSVMLHFLEELLAFLQSRGALSPQMASSISAMQAQLSGAVGGNGGFAAGVQMPPLPKIVVRTGGGYKVEQGSQPSTLEFGGQADQPSTRLMTGGTVHSNLVPSAPLSAAPTLRRPASAAPERPDLEDGGNFDVEVGDTVAAMEEWVDQARQVLRNAANPPQPAIQQQQQQQRVTHTAAGAIRQNRPASASHLRSASQASNASSAARSSRGPAAAGGKQTMSEIAMRGNQELDVTLVGRGQVGKTPVVKLGI